MGFAENVTAVHSGNTNDLLRHLLAEQVETNRLLRKQVGEPEIPPVHLTGMARGRWIRSQRKRGRK